MLILKALPIAYAACLLMPASLFVQEATTSQKPAGTGQVSAGQSTLTKQEYDALADQIKQAHSKALYDEEEKLAREGLERAQRAKKEGMTAYFQNALGSVFVARENFEAAYPLFQTALDTRIRLKDTEGIAESGNNLGLALTNMGRFEEAITAYNKSLEFVPNADVTDRADTLRNIGSVYHTAGRYDLALDFLLRSVDLLRNLQGASEDARQLYAFSLNSTADTYAELGQHEDALRYYRQAAALLEKFPDKSNLAVNYSSTGAVYTRMERFQEAIAYYQRALPLTQNNIVTLAGVQNNMGGNYQELGDWNQANTWLRQSLSNYENAHDQINIAASLDNLGFVATRLGHYDEAFDYLSRSLKQKQTLGNPRSMAETYRYLGGLYEQQRQWDKAEEAYGKARNLYEGVSRQVWDPADVGGFQEANQGHLYALYAAMLCKQHKEAQALTTADSGRVQGLTRQVAQSHVTFTAFSAEDAQQWQQTQASFFKASRLLRDARQQEAEASAPRKPQTQQLQDRQRQYEQAQSSLLQEQARLTHKYPQFQRLVGADPLTPAQLRQLAAKYSDTLFLHFNFLDREHLLLLTLSHKDGVREYTLSAPAGSKSVSVLIREWQESLAAFGRKTPDMSLSDKKQWDDLAKQEPTRAKTLSQILIAPLERSGLFAPGRYKRLVVVPEGPLCQIPMTALVTADGQRLTARYPVAVTASLGLLTWPSGTRPATGSMFFVADPVGRNGERLKNTTHGLALLGENPIPLPHIRNGSKRVAQMFAGAVGLTGAQATKPEVLKRLPNYDLLLLATHGYVMPDNGLLSSLLLAGEQGGYERLEAREILSQPLAARLVGLMACQSGAGTVSGGEGVLGLVWAFWAAGCPSVLASSWSVEDEATETLMVTFYRELRNGRSKDVALQKAMQTVQADPRWRHPFFWSAFQVYGNPDPVTSLRLSAGGKEKAIAFHAMTMPAK